MRFIKGLPVTIAADPAFDESSRHRRQGRQARVGILRNTNEPPHPPPRKAALTGRWLSLRSSRRPPEQRLVDAALSVVRQPDAGSETASLPADALHHDEAGRLAGIDVAGLMASVEGLGTSKPIRTPYGAQMRPDLPSEAVTPPPPRRKTQAVRGESTEAPAIDAAPSHAKPALPLRSRPSLLAPILGGVVLSLAVLILVPALLSL